MTATVRPVPGFVGQMDNPDVAGGERIGDFRFWPSAHPRFFVERGEALSFFIRVKPDTRLIAINPEPVMIPPGTGSAAPAEPGHLPSTAVTTAIRTAERGSGYWVDVKVAPVQKSGVFKVRLAIPPTARQIAGDIEGMLDVTLVVVDSSIVINPEAVDLGQISVSGMHEPTQVGYVNVRKLFGMFRVIGVSSCAEFIRVKADAIVRDKNYLLRIAIDPGKGIAPGRVDCRIVVQTDDAKHPRIEIPLKLLLVS
jgi:hypothetical protein